MGITLAKEFNGEIISCDSMQIYKNLDIGTAKPTKEEQNEVTHHLIDVVSPEESFSVERYSALAKKVIEDIYKRGHLPIMVGGTGLYVDNTVLGTQFSAPKRDEALSMELSRFAKENGNNALWHLLEKEDPQIAQKLHPNDLKRVIRALETVRTTGKKRSELDKESRPASSPYNYLYMAIDMERSFLYERIDRRVDIMLSDGLLEEVEKFILPSLKKMSTALTAIGYREAIWYFKGLCTKDEMVSLLKRNTRRYAKRQLTWLRRNKNVYWLSFNKAQSQAKELINNFLTAAKKRKDFDK